MIEGRSIICFAHDWGGDPTSKTHIMRILSRRNRVLWVNSIGMRRPRASRRDFERIIAKLRATAGGCVEVEPNLSVASPAVLPLPGLRWADRVNALLLVAWLRRLCSRLGLERPILWTFLPNVGRLVGHLSEELVVYHCVDEYSAFSGVPREALIRMEQDLVRRADLVITSSEQLCTERRLLNPNTHFVSHGVDTEHFGLALRPETPVPDDIRSLPHPVIGFFGLLAEWVDLDIVRELAVTHPQWSIVLVGKAVTDLGVLRGLANVHVLGQKPYATLPGYCRGFDVGIIPFRQDELTVRANPLKLREYLAAGLPVVATPLPEVRRYARLIKLASDAGSFARAIEAALQESRADWILPRTEAMAAETWEQRVQEISSLIAARLDLPRTPSSQPSS